SEAKKIIIETYKGKLNKSEETIANALKDGSLSFEKLTIGKPASGYDKYLQHDIINAIIDGNKENKQIISINGKNEFKISFVNEPHYLAHIINLMGAAGGIIVLVMGTVFGTGRTINALMDYKLFFACIAGLMLISLLIFLWQVKEPKLVEEMHEESRRYNIEEKDDDKAGGRRLSKGERTSLILILASVVFWFFGYNAITSKYSVYASSVLNLDYNTTLTIATGSAILSYIPVGAIASKIGRKKTILGGIIILGTAFLCASFIRAGSSSLVMNILFASAA
ncbi:MAG: MFS transporter, partial [Clostridia bacterium]|nr:MFS transporter [Clostridia bacterium]